jgi:hypothetical protein
MTWIRLGRSIGIGLIVLAMAGCDRDAGLEETALAPATAAAESSAAAPSFDTAAAEAYCTEKGGELVDRVATWNTNGDPAARLPLAGRLRLCEFETGTGDTATRISVDLVTLYSEAPTIAAVAYLSKVPPLQTPTASTNPAAYQCTAALGGTSTWGNTNNAGGWVDAAQPVFTIMDLCVFPDLSTIDEFGIWYYASGIVRGVDLAPILRYQPGDKLPAMFERVRP